MLVHALVVHVVEVTVMQVVDVSGVPHGCMSAAWPVNMRMALVCGVPAGHVVLQCRSPFSYRH
jgi:hypothetical protein